MNKTIHHSHKTASFYGFRHAPDHIKEFKVAPHDQVKIKRAIKRDGHHHAEDRLALVRLFLEKKMNTLPQPAMIFYKGALKRDSGSISNHGNAFNLEIIGNPKSIADALIIETSYVISKEEYGDHNIELEINSIGDKESLRKFEKELRDFYRKHCAKLPPELRQSCKRDIFELLKMKDGCCPEVKEQVPSPMAHLSESSRNHFREVLEYIEMLGLPYSINPVLIGDPVCGSDTVFEIVSKNDGSHKVLARGQRYNHVARKFLNKKEVPSMGSSIFLKTNPIKYFEDQKEKMHKLFFIQLGYEAKLKSLQVLETLRKARVSVFQSLSKDKMGVQIAMAEKMNIPYIAIMGKKEAVEGSVLVRHMATRCQDTVPLVELADYARRLK